MAMEEVTSSMTIAVIMVHLVCHEAEYSWRKHKAFSFQKKRPVIFGPWNTHSLGYFRPSSSYDLDTINATQKDQRFLPSIYHK